MAAIARTAAVVVVVLTALTLACRWASGSRFTAIDYDGLVIGAVDEDTGYSNQQYVSAPEAPTDVHRGMADLVLPHGYPLEEHFLTTADGYILRIFRIPHGLSNSRHGSSGRPVVFLQHALLDSSAGYVIMGPGQSLGFVLADEGYDVWMTNVRGNRFSRNHTCLDPDLPADATSFWSYSWDHHVQLDLPAAIEYVVSETGAEQVQYVGYSQGTTIGFAALASMPSVAARIRSAVLLAPVAFVTHMSSPLFRAMAELRADVLFNLIGMREYGGYRPALADASSTFCAAMPGACLQYLYLLCGRNPEQGGNVDRALVPLIFRYLPHGTSVHNMQHWSQMVRATSPTSLPMFDYGSDCKAGVAIGEHPSAARAAAFCNQEAYGRDTPPQYNLSAITAATPLALFTGGRDTLGSPEDVALLLGVLQPGGAVALHHHEPGYGHLDFGIGADAAERIYPLVLEFFRQHPAGVAGGAATAASDGASGGAGAAATAGGGRAGGGSSFEEGVVGGSAVELSAVGGSGASSAAAASA